VSDPAAHHRGLPEGTIILVTSLGHAVCHMGELAFVGVKESVRLEFGLSHTGAASLGLLGYVLLGLGAIPAGLWADAWGPRRVFAIYFLAMAAAALSVVAAPNVGTLFAAFTGVGLAASLYHPVGIALLSLGVSPASRGRALGINGVAGSLGVALGPSLGMVAADLGPGMWRLAYVAVAAASLLAGALMVWASRRVPDIPPAAPALAPVPSPPRWTNLLPLGLLLLAMMFGGLNYRLLLSGLPLFFGGPGGTATQAAGGILVFVVLIVGAVGQYGGGWLGDRLGARRVYPLSIGLLVLTAWLLGRLGGSLLALPVACLAAVGLFASQPIENSLMAEWTSAGRRSSWYGIKFALTFGVGALGLQLHAWVTEQSSSADTGFLVLAGSAGVMGIIAVAALLVRSRVSSSEALDLHASNPQAMSVPPV
jgi:FSR family fosmidomycin resistance protein-like MFS transporter